jgi:DNA-binding MarR family transcriptional regulator
VSADAAALLGDTALAVFRLNGQLLDVAEELARPAGLTAAWWQVLGAVLDEPLPVAGIARKMGITRQSVQRIADLLVADGLCAYQDNPHHQRAKLLELTPAGRTALDSIDAAQHNWCDALGDKIGEQALRRTATALQRVAGAVESTPL